MPEPKPAPVEPGSAPDAPSQPALPSDATAPPTQESEADESEIREDTWDPAAERQKIPGANRKGRRSTARLTQNFYYTFGSVVGGVSTGKGKINIGSAGADAKERTDTERSDYIWAISAGEVSECRKTYVVAPSDGRAKAILAKHRLVILVGGSGKGKSTSALMLASADGGASQAVLEIDPGIAIPDLARLTFQKKTTYLIRGWSVQLPPDARVAQRLCARLQETEARLVISLDLTAREGTTHHSVMCSHEMAPQDEIAKAWIGALAGSPQEVEAAAALLTNEQIRSLLITSAVEQILDLAEQLIAIAREETTLDEVLARRRTRAREGIAQDISEGKYDVLDRAFMVSVSVLGGLGDGTINIAESALRDLYLDTLDPTERKRLLGSIDIDRSRGTKVTRVGARIETSLAFTPFGRIPVETIRLPDSDDDNETLAALWREYGGDRAALLKWLCDLGRHRGAEVRVRAGLAAGRLSQVDFLTLYQNVLDEWAHGLRSESYLALEVALWVLTLHDEWIAIPRRLLFQWSGTQNVAYARMVLHVFDDALGVAYVNEVLEQLPKIIANHGTKVLWTVVRSIGNLAIALRREGDSVQVLIEALKSWTDQRTEQALVHCGLLGFLRTTELAVSNEERSHDWPLLLPEIAAKRLDISLVGTIWRRSLRLPDTQSAAWSCLLAWIQLADDQPDALAVIKDVLDEIIRHDVHSEDANRLVYLVENALHEDDSNTDATRTIMSWLKPEGRR